MHQLESQAAADGLIHEHLRLHKAEKETRKVRGLIFGAGLVCAVMAALTIWRFAPWWRGELLTQDPC